MIGQLALRSLSLARQSSSRVALASYQMTKGSSAAATWQIRSSSSVFSGLRTLATEAAASPAASEKREGEKEETTSVPRNLVRFIIGSKGANLRALLERAQGGTILFTKRKNERDEEIAVIKGDDAQIETLKKLLAEELEKAKVEAANAESQPPREGGEREREPRGERRAPREGGFQKPDGSYVEDVIVDALYVGRLIGKQGVVLKEMERASGARINYVDAEPDAKERRARLRGTPEQVQAAKKLITDRVFAAADNARKEQRFGGSDRPPRRSMREPNPKDVKQVVEVPSDVIGALIGAQGRGIRYMQDTTLTSIDVAKQDHRDGAREVTIIGSEENVQKACELLQSRLKEALDRRDQRGSDSRNA